MGNLLMTILARFLKDESGATAIEYGLIAALVGVAIITALNNYGDATEAMYDKIETSVVNATK